MLQLIGLSLGGPESARWVTLFQALLTGWVAYVGAGGLLYEGLIGEVVATGNRWGARASLVVAAGTALLYAISLVRSVRPFVTPAAGNLARHTFYHWVICLIVAWSAFNWWRLARGRENDRC